MSKISKSLIDEFIRVYKKYKKLLGDWYYSLIKFHEADEGAH